MKIENLIDKNILDQLPVLFRTLTIVNVCDLKDKEVQHKYKRKFYKATILPFHFK